MAAIPACSQTSVGITTEVKAKLIADPVVSAAEIQVETHEGVVTLKGNIDSKEAKQHALDLARSTRGVRKVKDLIEVRLPSGEGEAPKPGRTIGVTIDDAVLTMRVKRRLLDDPGVKALKIDVDTREGIVYLTGSVATEDMRLEAIKQARNTDGVKEVLANLKVTEG
jgi:hyperosmotically inducible protein